MNFAGRSTLNRPFSCLARRQLGVCVLFERGDRRPPGRPRVVVVAAVHYAIPKEPWRQPPQADGRENPREGVELLARLLDAGAESDDLRRAFHYLGSRVVAGDLRYFAA